MRLKGQTESRTHTRSCCAGAHTSRLKAHWAKEYETWRKIARCKVRSVYLSADGVYSGLRAEDERLCMLVLIGVNERGQRRALAIDDRKRGSIQAGTGVAFLTESGVFD